MSVGRPEKTEGEGTEKTAQATSTNTEEMEVVNESARPEEMEDVREDEDNDSSSSFIDPLRKLSNFVNLADTDAAAKFMRGAGGVFRRVRGGLKNLVHKDEKQAVNKSINPVYNLNGATKRPFSERSTTSTSRYPFGQAASSSSSRLSQYSINEEVEELEQDGQEQDWQEAKRRAISIGSAKDILYKLHSQLEKPDNLAVQLTTSLSVHDMVTDQSNHPIFTPIELFKNKGSIYDASHPLHSSLRWFQLRRDNGFKQLTLRTPKVSGGLFSNPILGLDPQKELSIDEQILKINEIDKKKPHIAALLKQLKDAETEEKSTEELAKLKLAIISAALDEQRKRIRTHVFCHMGGIEDSMVLYTREGEELDLYYDDYHTSFGIQRHFNDAKTQTHATPADPAVQPKKLADGKYAYVIVLNREGNIDFRFKKANDSVHMTLRSLNFEKVLAAGELIVKNGQFVFACDNSGTFGPACLKAYEAGTNPYSPEQWLRGILGYTLPKDAFFPHPGEMSENADKTIDREYMRRNLNEYIKSEEVKKEAEEAIEAANKAEAINKAIKRVSTLPLFKGLKNESLSDIPIGNMLICSSSSIPIAAESNTQMDEVKEESIPSITTSPRFGGSGEK